MRKRTLRAPMFVAVLVAALALFAAACGGSADTAASSSSESVTSGTIVFSGLVDYPMDFTFLDMDYMDWVTVTAEEPTAGATEYQGVLVSDIFSYVGVQADATTVVVTAADGSTSEIALADVSDDALLVVGEDDSLNAVMPGMASEAWVDDVVAMDFK